MILRESINLLFEDTKTCNAFNALLVFIITWPYGGVRNRKILQRASTLILR